MRIMNKSTMILATLLVLAACQGDEKAAKVQEPVPQAAVSPPSQMQEPKAQAVEEQVARAKPERTTLPTRKPAPMQANAAKLNDMAAARQQMDVQQAAAMKKTAAMEKTAVKREAKPLAAPLEKAALKQQTPVKNIAAESSPPAGDVQRGKKLAKKCVACHDFGSRNKMGPALGGVFNRQAGTQAAYKYTYAVFIADGKAWRWDAAHLAAWLCDSTAAVRVFTGNPTAKTKMPRQRICDAAKQRDIIAYLKTL